MGDLGHPKLMCRESGTVIELNSNPFSIGRGLSCNYVIIKKSVSRVHCVLEKNDNTWVLKDTSTNGTYINGKLMKGDKGPPLKEGDIIKFDEGGESYTFQTEASNRADDISDEQLCIFADSVLNEVAAFQQDTQNQDHNEPFPRGNINVNVNNLEDVMPVTTNVALQYHAGMVKTDVHLSKKQKTEVQPSNAAHASSVDLSPSGCASSVNTGVRTSTAVPAPTSSANLTQSSITSSDIPVDKSIEKPGPSVDAEKEPPDVTSTSDIEPTEKPVQPPPLATTDQQDNYEVMENELQCSICSELFVKAVTLTCSHTFCKFCIELWKKNKSECPICRTKITGMTATLVLDNVIEKVIEGSTEDIKQHRKQLLDDRKLQETVNPPPKENTRGRGRGRRGRAGRRGNYPPPGELGATYGFVIEVSSDSNSDSDDSTETDSDDTNEYWRDDYDQDDWYDSGVPGNYYGGYGNCFSCGRRGHWANGCPYR